MVSFSLLTNLFKDTSFEVELDSRLCLKNRLNGCHCRLCLDDCPAQALSYIDNRLLIDTVRCTGCMRCTAVCPSDALRPDYDVVEQLVMVRQGNNDCVVFSCPRQKRFSPAEVVIPCLAVFSEEALLYLATSGNLRAVHFNAAGCSDCRNKEALSSMKALLENLRDRHGDIIGPKLQVIDRHEERTEAADRRSFLAVMKNGVLSAAGSSLQSTTARKSIPPSHRRIPLKTELRQKTINRFPAGKQHPLLSRLTPQLTIGEECIPCSRCSGICPTGALKLERSKDSKQLIFHGENCSSCGLCLSFCKRGALALSSPFLAFTHHSHHLP
jgi:ferredoxin